ncbi:hypothetical protein SDC9_151752 [bioreactor metagenome]|uniref:Uncharacterized protein n=1 Tax=bioreactor metagenome TaxID=1076179 RepID=A0A645ER71_9ZZZZ
MGGRRQFQPAADHCALHGGDDRNAAILDAVENAVPAARMLHHPKRLAMLMLGEIQPGAEVIALTRQDDGPCALRSGDQRRLQRCQQAVADRVALVRTRQGDGIDVVIDRGLDQLFAHARFPWGSECGVDGDHRLVHHVLIQVLNQIGAPGQHHALVDVALVGDLARLHRRRLGHQQCARRVGR